jgi:hypothetical protein
MPPIFRRISLGSTAFYLGLILTTIGFWAYFTDRPTLNLAGFFYGIPVLLIGIALRTAQLKPVPYSEPTTDDVAAARELYATDNQKQIRKDMLGYRYAEKAHLGESLEALGLAPTDEERPLITALRETLTDGAYTLVIEFDSPMMNLEKWQSKQTKMVEFFGPDIRVEIEQPEEEYIDLLLISTRKADSTASSDASPSSQAA